MDMRFSTDVMRILCHLTHTPQIARNRLGLNDPAHKIAQEDLEKEEAVKREKEEERKREAKKKGKK